MLCSMSAFMASTSGLIAISSDTKVRGGHKGPTAKGKGLMALHAFPSPPHRLRWVWEGLFDLSPP